MERNRPIVGDDLDLDPRAELLKFPQLPEFVRADRYRPVEALSAGTATHSAQVHDLDWDAGSAQSQHRARRAGEDDDQFRRSRQLDAAGRAPGHVADLNRHTLR